MLILQIISALLLLANKVYVYRKKTIGWSFGIWGTIAITIYFYLQMVLENKLNLWIMVVYDIALLFLMIYGYLLSHAQNNNYLRDKLKRWGLIFKLTVVSITSVVCIFLLIQAINAHLVLVQFISAITGLIGTLLLAFNIKTTNRVGWVFYFIAHCFVTFLMLKTHSPYIAACQIFSAIVALMGLNNELKNKLKVVKNSNRLH